jgi:hypothetical protein
MAACQLLGEVLISKSRLENHNMFNKKCEYNYIYSLYGLIINSEIPMKELVVLENAESRQPDVFISYGVVPKEIDEVVVKTEYVKLAKREFYLHIEGTAHYYASNGNTIIVEPEPDCDMHEMIVFILGTCLGVLLNQRGTIAIHGGSVVVNGQGIIITGDTGAGKSTLISFLTKKGFDLLADDVSALGCDLKDNYIIYPAYPQQKLCRDVMENMNYDIKRFSKTDPYRDKYLVPLKKGFQKLPVQLSAIYEISTGESKKVEIVEILGSEKLKTILRNIYRIELTRYLGQGPQFFKQCINIANAISVYKITRPKLGLTVTEQIELIQGTLETAATRVI